MTKENEMNVPVTLDNDSGDSWLIVRRAVDHALPSDTSMLGDYRVRDNLASSLLDYLTTPRLHKPEEPTGLGAVVSVRHGSDDLARAVRTGSDGQDGENWYYSDSSSGGWRSWGALDVVEVLFEGVPQ